MVRSTLYDEPGGRAAEILERKKEHSTRKWFLLQPGRENKPGKKKSSKVNMLSY